MRLGSLNQQTEAQRLTDSLTSVHNETKILQEELERRDNIIKSKVKFNFSFAHQLSYPVMKFFNTGREIVQTSPANATARQIASRVETATGRRKEKVIGEPNRDRQTAL